MKTCYALIFILAFSISNVSAQLDEFDLGEFVLPEVSLKKLNFSGYLGGQSQNQSSALNTGVNSNSSFNVNFAYSNYESAADLQKNVSGNLTSSFRYVNSTFDTNGFPVQNAVQNSSLLSVNNERRNYFTKNKFYGVNYNVWLRNTFNSGENNGNIRFFENSIQTTVGVPFTFGFGRIEPVSDAWSAIRILEDLERLNVLSHSPSYDEIYDLAETLSRIRNDRIFDNRLGRIKRIQKLDDHFLQSGLIKDHNSAYFTSLYDMYQNGIQTTRFSGERITFALAPEISLQSYKDETTSTFYQYSLFGIVEYDFNYPISQLLQLDINARVKGGLTRSDSGTNNWNANPNVKIKAGLYPNSRTFFSSELNLGGVYGLVSDVSNKFSFYANLKGNIYYFISPRTAISLNLVYLYSQAGSNNILTPYIGLDGFRFNYNISLTHSFY
jgi:hypothetical protein